MTRITVATGAGVLSAASTRDPFANFERILAEARSVVEIPMLPESVRSRRKTAGFINRCLPEARLSLLGSSEKRRGHQLLAELDPVVVRIARSPQGPSAAHCP